MGKFSPVAIAPRYMLDFQCLGGDCPETCCQGWRVGIDKATYKKYQEVKLADVRATLKAAVERSTDTSHKDYARIKLGADGFCPLLTPEKLCGLQAKLGADYLSNTCLQYPRAYGRAGEQHYFYASLSCPETARLAITQPDALDEAGHELPFANPQAVPLNYRRNFMGTGTAEELASSQLDSVRATAEMFHQTAIALVRHNELSASEAAVAVGFAIRRAVRAASEAADKHTGAEGIAHALLQAQSPAATDGIRAQMQQLAAGGGAASEQQLAILCDFTARYLERNPQRSSLRSVVGDALAGFGYSPDDPAGSAARFRAAHDDWFKPFDSAHPWLLKNYLLNDIGMRVFPREGIEAIEEEWLRVSLRLALIRLYLVGLAAKRGAAFGADDYVRAVYTFGRHIEHNRDFMPGVMAVLDEHEMKSLATAAVALA
jgi:lysine-N-methylase